jgi:branched-chain amino acid transport system substrate-binding protein
MKEPYHRHKKNARSQSWPSSSKGQRDLVFGAVVCLLLVQATLAEENLTCGVILPLSGESGVIGTDILHGIELAAEEMNSTSNASGYRVDLRIADDTGDPATALSLFHEMKAEGIPVVIGSYSTNLTISMAEETKDPDSAILISPQANGESLYGISPRFFQVNPPVFSLAQFISEWLSYTSDRPAVIYADDEYGISMMQNIRKQLVPGSLPGLAVYPVQKDGTDYTAFVESVLNSAPDAVVIIIYDSGQIPVIRNLSEAGYRGQVILTESSYMDTLERNETDILARFPLFTISSYANLVPGDHTDRFVSAYTSRYGTVPNMTLAGYGYDSLMVITDALRVPGIDGNITIDRIREGLHGTRYYGVTGPKVFDRYNVPASAMDRWAFRDRKFVLMTTSLV